MTKPRLSFALILAAAMCTGTNAVAQTGYSDIVGYQTITLGPGYNFVGISFKNTTQDETFDIQTLFDTSKLAGGVTQLGSDQIFLWDAEDQQYIQLWLFDSGGTYEQYDGKWIDAGTGDVADWDVGLGDGLWYISTADEFVDVTVSGAVEMAASATHVTVVPAPGRDYSYNLVASAYPVSKPINEMDWNGFTGGVTQLGGDQIFLWDASAQEYVQLWYFHSNGVYPAYDGKWIDTGTGDVADASRIVACGQALWILKQDGTAVVQNRPF